MPEHKDEAPAARFLRCVDVEYDDLSLDPCSIGFAIDDLPRLVIETCRMLEFEAQTQRLQPHGRSDGRIVCLQCRTALAVETFWFCSRRCRDALRAAVGLPALPA